MDKNQIEIIMEDELQISYHSEFITDHYGDIEKHLTDAYNEMRVKETSPIMDKAPSSELNGIHQCLHLATTIFLLGSTSRNLRTTLDYIKAINVGGDSNSILTVVTLYYFITEDYIKADLKPNREKRLNILSYIHQRFDSINWMLNSEIILKLGICEYSKLYETLKKEVEDLPLPQKKISKV